MTLPQHLQGRSGAVGAAAAVLAAACYPLAGTAPSLLLLLAAALCLLHAGQREVTAAPVKPFDREPAKGDPRRRLEARFSRLRDVDLSPDRHYFMQAWLHHVPVDPGGSTKASRGDVLETERALLVSTPVFSAQQLAGDGEGAILERSPAATKSCVLVSNRVALDLELYVLPSGCQPPDADDKEAPVKASLACKRTLLLEAPVLDFRCAAPVLLDAAGHFCAPELRVTVQPEQQEKGGAGARQQPAGALDRLWPPLCAGGACGEGRCGELVCRCLAPEGSSSAAPAALQEEVLGPKDEPPADAVAVPRGAGAGHFLAVVPCPLGLGPPLPMLLGYLTALLPEAHLTSFSTTREQCAELHRAGVRLAQEAARQFSASGAERLSLVAVGAGGLLVRAALPWLQEYSDELRVLLTVSTPHLGLRPSGMSWPDRLRGLLWRPAALKSMQRQLELGDGRDCCESLLYRLSGDAGPGRFRNLVLLQAEGSAAPVPARSALVQGQQQGAAADGEPAELAEAGGRGQWAPWIAAGMLVAAVMLAFLWRYWRLVFVLVPGTRWPRICRLLMLGGVVVVFRVKGLRQVMEKGKDLPALQGRFAGAAVGSKGPAEAEMAGRFWAKLEGSGQCRVVRGSLSAGCGDQALARSIAFAYAGLFE